MLPLENGDQTGEFEERVDIEWQRVSRSSAWVVVEHSILMIPILSVLKLHPSVKLPPLLSLQLILLWEAVAANWWVANRILVSLLLTFNHYRKTGLVVVSASLLVPLDHFINPWLPCQAFSSLCVVWHSLFVFLSSLAYLILGVRWHFFS